MFKFWNSPDQQGQSRPPEVSPQPWYSPSLVGSPNSSRPPTSSQPPSHVPPGEAAGIIVLLKDKSVDELRKLLSDKDAYQRFLLSLDQTRTQSNIKDELRKETLQLARENLEKETRIMELRNQCRIIRTTELAAAQEKLNELEKLKEEILKIYSPGSLLHKLQEAMKQADEESESLHRQLLDKEIDLSSFMHKYKKLRVTYHRRALVYLAAKSSAFG